METIVIVYRKNGKIQVLNKADEREKHEALKKQGWEHRSIVNAIKFMEEIFNNVPDESLRKAINAVALH